MKFDGIYLYGNDTVLDLYPKFGFVTATEYQYTKQISAVPKNFAKLHMSSKENLYLLEQYYNKENMFDSSKMLLPLLSHA